jgi:UDP-N-acetylmuramate: L-alanyl-gamma-D-glutamyl-meso-diaminopimelate ligase
MKVHFIAIGGSAMHNLAIAMKKNGYEVSGSDDEIFEPSKSRLKKYGLLPENEGWYPEKLSKEIDFIILGMHARPDNPELIKAKELGIKIFSYPEFLFEHSKDKKRIVIGGSHGKTTITAMVMHVLSKLDKDFDYLVGSKLKDFEVMVRLSDTADMMIFEGDEYLSSPVDMRPKFHWYHPHIALLSGIAWDHINVFPTFENYKFQFQKFIELIENNGTLIYSEDDMILKEIVENNIQNIKKIPYKTLSYNIKEGITYVNTNDKNIPLKIFGKHNMQNLNGAKLICNELGIDDKTFFENIKSFEGAAKRLELISESGKSKVYKDFAHAPSKVKATINAVKEQFLSQKVIACLELHTFSSLNNDFITQYKGAMNTADEACVYFNPHALKMKQLPMLNKEEIKTSFGNKKITVINTTEEVKKWLKKHKSEDSVFLLMSSGNFGGIKLDEFGKELV